MERRRVGFAAALALLICATGCSSDSLRIPADPDGTMDRIESGTLRAGVAAEEGIAAPASGRGDGEAEGPAADLVRDFARAHGAAEEWVFGSEETLVAELERGELDLVIGGISPDTPWQERAGVTRGYRGLSEDPDRELAMLVPMGENRLLSELESFLDEEAAS